MRRGSNHNVKTVDTRLHGDAGVVHMAADVSENFGFEPELAYGFAILPRLLRGGWGRQLDVVHAKVVQGFGDSDLGLRVEESVRKLLALAKGRLDCKNRDMISYTPYAASPKLGKDGMGRYTERNSASRELGDGRNIRGINALILNLETLLRGSVIGGRHLVPWGLAYRVRFSSASEGLGAFQTVRWKDRDHARCRQ